MRLAAAEVESAAQARKELCADAKAETDQVGPEQTRTQPGPDGVITKEGREDVLQATGKNSVKLGRLPFFGKRQGAWGGSVRVDLNGSSSRRNRGCGRGNKWPRGPT